MKDRHLREIVEIVGVISIVAALLLVAREIHESNRIAVTEIEMRLGQGFDELHLRRATTPDFAKLYPKMRAPGNHLVTATEESQIEGLAQHLVDIYYSAQVAYDNGLLGTQDLEAYRQDLVRTLEQLPGLAGLCENQRLNPRNARDAGISAVARRRGTAVPDGERQPRTPGLAV